MALDVKKLAAGLTPEQKTELLRELQASPQGDKIQPRSAATVPAQQEKFVPPPGLEHNEQPSSKAVALIEQEIQVDNFLSTEQSAPLVDPNNPFLPAAVSGPLPQNSHEIIRDKYFDTGIVDPDTMQEDVAAHAPPPLPPPPEGMGLEKRNARAEPGKPLTLADTTGPALKDEFDRDRAKMRNDTAAKAAAKPPVKSVIKQARANVDLSDPMVAMCPKELREKQPDGFDPYSLINRRIREFLSQPTLKGGLALSNRVVFEQKDRPSVSIENSVMFGFEPIVVLGRALTSGATKMYVGYAQPGPEALTEALRFILTTLKNWAMGKEFIPEKEAAANVTGTMRRTDGSVITDASNRPMRPTIGQFVFKPKIHVYQPLDYTEQVAVVIA